MFASARARFGLPSLAIFALVAAVAMVAGTPEAFAAVGHVAVHAGDAHGFLTHALGASLSVAALRAKVGDLETRANAKMAEVKDGLTSDEIRTIETDHGTLLTELEGARRDLATAEDAERRAQAAGGAPSNSPDLETIRAQERMAERSRQVAIRGAATKLGLGEDFYRPHVERGTSIDEFRGLAIDAAAARQAPIANPNPAASDPGHRTYAQAKEDVPRGTNATRALIALAACHGNKRDAADFVTAKYGDAGKTVARALAASIGNAGGFLVPPDMSEEVIELLRPASVVMSLGPRILQMPRGQMMVPRITGGATANYVGENQPIAAVPAAVRHGAALGQEAHRRGADLQRHDQVPERVDRRDRARRHGEVHRRAR